MDPALYYKIYREGVDEQIIPRYIKYTKSLYLHNLIINYIQKD